MTNRKRTKKSSPQRTRKSSIFRAFLIDTFGEELLRSGTGVIDVAGGKGQLSYELLNLNRIPAAVIDPVSLDGRIFTRGVSRGQWHCKKKLFRVSVPFEEAKREVKTPDHFRCVFHPHLWEDDAIGLFVSPTAKEKKSESSTLEYRAFLAAQTKIFNRWTAKTRRKKALDTENKKHFVKPWDLVMSEENFQNLKQKLQGCSLIVGLHPDQSTDYIIDYALITEKPFAVIPCCLHSKQFSGKKNAKRQAIRDFDVLLEYYKQKAPGYIFSKTLDFNGKNTVIYGNIPGNEIKTGLVEGLSECDHDVSEDMPKVEEGLPHVVTMDRKSIDSTIDIGLVPIPKI